MMPVYHALNSGSYTAAAAKGEYDLVFAGYKPTSRLWSYIISCFIYSCYKHNRFYHFPTFPGLTGEPLEVSKSIFGDTGAALLCFFTQKQLPVTGLWAHDV